MGFIGRPSENLSTPEGLGDDMDGEDWEDDHDQGTLSGAPVSLTGNLGHVDIPDLYEPVTMALDDENFPVGTLDPFVVSTNFSFIDPSYLRELMRHITTQSITDWIAVGHCSLSVDIERLDIRCRSRGNSYINPMSS